MSCHIQVLYYHFITHTLNSSTMLRNTLRPFRQAVTTSSSSKEVLKPLYHRKLNTSRYRNGIGEVGQSKSCSLFGGTNNVYTTNDCPQNFNKHVSNCVKIVKSEHVSEPLMYGNFCKWRPSGICEAGECLKGFNGLLTQSTLPVALLGQGRLCCIRNLTELLQHANYSSQRQKEWDRHSCGKPVPEDPGFKPKDGKVPPLKRKRCFLSTKVRLPTALKCAARSPACPPPPEECKRPCIEVKPKTLPTLVPTKCRCVEPFVPRITPKIKRLNLYCPEPKRICIEEYCGWRDPPIVVRKKLPPYKPKPCPCVEPRKLIDVRLKRLTKICPPEVCNPPRICPIEEKCERLDPNKCVKQKELPILKPKECPCVGPPPMKDVKLKRINIKVPEPLRVCPCVPDCPCIRADDAKCIKRKKLPKIVPGVCPCVDKPMTDVNFRRLECIDYGEPCDPEDPCIPYPMADFGCWEYYTPDPTEQTEPTKPCKPKDKKRKRKAKETCCFTDFPNIVIK